MSKPEQTGTYLFIITDIDGNIVYTYPELTNRKFLNAQAKLIQTIVRYKKYLLTEKENRIKINISDGALYILPEDMYIFSLLASESEDEDSIWGKLETIANKFKKVKKPSKLEKVIKEVLYPPSGKDLYSRLYEISKKILNKVLIDRGEVPLYLGTVVKQQVYPLLKDKSIIEKEKDIMRRKILEMCNGKNTVDDIASATNTQVVYTMIILADYSAQGLIDYKVQYDFKL